MSSGWRWSADAAVRRLSTFARWSTGSGGRELAKRKPRLEPGASSLYQHVPFRQDTSYLSVGERTNANGSKAFREAMLEDRWDDCVEIARSQIREGAHMLDLNIDYVGRDGPADMRTAAFRLATSSTLPIMLDSTEPEVIEAGLESLAGRSVINSVNYEDGDGPGSRFARVMPIIKEHGAAVVALTIDEEGQARTADWKVQVASRLIDDLTGKWGMRTSDIIVDCLTFPIGTGQEETRRDGLETINAIREVKRKYPDVQTTLGVSNISFGLSPATRVVLNSVFLHECVKAGLDSAIVHTAKIMPMSRIPDEQRQVALDLVYDRRDRGLRPAAEDAGDLLRRHDDRQQGRPGRRARCAAAARATPAPDHRRREDRARSRPRRGARQRAARRSTSSTTTCWPG